MRWSGRPYVSAAAGCAFALLFSVPAVCAAPAPSVAARFQHFTVEQGLSQNNVRAIWQDPTGFLWVATEEGLNRFDGYDFLVFKHHDDDPTSLPHNMVTALAPESSGNLWVGTLAGAALFDLRTETFTERVRTTRLVMAVVEDRDGTLWVGTDGDGVYRLDKKATRATHYIASPQDADGLSHNSVYALLQDKQGQVWVGTFGGGLDRFDRKANRFVHYRHDPADPASLGHNDIWSLAEDTKGRIWAGTNGGGVSVLDPATGRFRQYRHSKDPKSLDADVVVSLYRDRAGVMWLGPDRSGLNRYVPDDDSFVTHDPESFDSLGRNVVRTIYEDSQHNLWASTVGDGLILMRRSGHPFTYYSGQSEGTSGLIDRAVVSFLEDRQGGFWVGTGEGGMHRFDPATGRFKRYKLDRATILAQHQDRHGRIWVSTWGEGLFRFDPDAGTFTRYQKGIDVPGTRVDDQIWSIDEDPDGTLWLATDLGAVHLNVDTGEVKRLQSGPDGGGLVYDQVRAFLRESNGDRWIATLGGLDVLHPDGTIEHYRNERHNPKSLSHDWVMALHRDRRGRLWVATYGGGLNLFDDKTKTFTSYKEEAGLPSNTVYALLEDDAGRMWLSTNKGLCRFDLDSGGVETYDVTNGLQTQQFNPRAAVRTRTGSMLFGTVNGFYYFDPRRITANPVVPAVALTSFRVFDQPRKGAVAISHAEEIQLKYDETVFSLEFAVLDFTFPRRNRYQYKLEGASERWLPLGTKHDITVAKLDPGGYTLRIKASNSDGVWDEEGHALHIRITPPFWATWWFRTLFVSASVGLLYWAHRWRVASHEKREHELEGRVDEAMARVKILRGLLPICSACKKVRDDQGYWNQIESYIRDRSEADFTHGLCPDCIPKFYPHRRTTTAAGGSE
jgi:ligand-binding sensor domain-containing protein